GNRLNQSGAARDVRVLVRGDLDAALLRRFNQRDGVLHPAEVLRAGDLQVQDLHGQLRALANIDRLLDTLPPFVAVVAQVRDLSPPRCRGRPGERNQFVGLRVRVRRVDETGRRAVGTLRHRVSHERRHPRQLLGRWRALLVAHHEFAYLAETDVREQIDGDFRFLDRGEVAGEVAPRTRGAGLLRRHRSALADDLGRHALADLPLGVTVGQQRRVGVGVRIDEAGCEHFAARVDHACGGAGYPSDCGNAAVADADGAGSGRRAGTVDDAGVGDEEIERPRTRLL